MELSDRANLLVLSQLVHPEARAALAAAARASRIVQPTHVNAVAALEDFYAQSWIITIAEPLAPSRRTRHTADPARLRRRPPRMRGARQRRRHAAGNVDKALKHIV